jgi:hypothetical protein
LRVTWNNDRSPRIAKIFEVKMIKGSSVMPKIAGIESTANSTSDNSTQRTTRRSGVARRTPSTW